MDVHDGDSGVGQHSTAYPLPTVRDCVSLRERT